MSDYTSDLDAAIVALEAATAQAQATVDDHSDQIAALATRVAALEVGNPPPPPPPPPPLPSASFTLDKTTGNAPLTVQSTITVTNGDLYQITWDDGLVGIVHPPSDPSPTHVYQQIGTYHPQVKVWSSTYPAGVNVAGPTVTAVQAPIPVGSLGQQFGGISTPLAQAATFTYIDAVAAAGFGWYRKDLRMADISPTKGTWNWGQYDSWIDHVVAKGMRYLPIVYMLPSWMNGNSDDKYQPTNPQDYADWCATAAMHLWTHGVTHMELWNEQNWGFWKPTPSRTAYVTMANLAADAIHAAAPGMTVVAGGVSTADTQYQAGQKSVTVNGVVYNSPEFGSNCTLDIYGKLGLYQHVDAVGIHPYLDGVDPGIGTDPNWCAWEQTAMRRTIAIIDRWAPGRNLTVWNTESACPRSTTSESIQATRAAHAFQAFNTWTLADGSKMRNRLGPFFWFTFVDWIPGQPAREASFGLVDPNYNPHQALGAVSPILKGALT